MKGFHEWCISQYGTVDGGQKDSSQTQARWSKGYALHEELYGCRAFLEYILLCHTNKWTPMKAHTHLKTHIPHIGNLTANELAAVVLWCNLKYRREYVTETTIGSAVMKSVKDKWLEGEGENATVKIVIRDAGLDNGLSPFGTEQLACNLTHCKEELDIHVEDQTYTILSPFMGRGDKKREMISYITRKGKVMSSFSCIEKGDQKVWKEWRENGFGVNSEKRTQPTRTHYNWWDWDFDRKDFLHSFVEHCECHLLNPFYIAFPNKELQREGGDKAGIEAMIDYMNKHDIPLSSIPEWTRKFLEGEKDVSLGYWLTVKASNRQGEHSELFGYEELSGDDFLFDGNDSFDLIAVDHECGVEASTEPCASVNPLQDASPSINLSQERGKK
jgi:hypothetical protein